MYADGDGRITRNSFLPVTKDGHSSGKPLFPIKTTFFTCAEHHRLLDNETIQNKYLTVLAAETGANTAGVK